MAQIKLAIYGVWAAGLLFWLLASVAAKRTVRKQSRASELAQGALAGSGFVLLFNRQIHIASLETQLLPHTLVVACVALLLTILGIGLLVWSRIALGRNWSATVTIKQDHRLIHSGPYAAVRHPLYSGVLLAMLGTAIFFGDLRGFLAFALTFAGWWFKSQTEERFMLEQFGAEYRNYQQQVKAFIPYLL